MGIGIQDLRMILGKDLRTTIKAFFSTKNRGPWRLIYYEGCPHENDARAREKYLKSGMGKRYLRNRLKSFLNKGFD
jgi:predicted GIY-YIG superfamily endonuclease